MLKKLKRWREGKEGQRGGREHSEDVRTGQRLFSKKRIRGKNRDKQSRERDFFYFFFFKKMGAEEKREEVKEKMIVGVKGQ